MKKTICILSLLLFVTAMFSQNINGNMGFREINVLNKKSQEINNGGKNRESVTAFNERDRNKRVDTGSASQIDLSLVTTSDALLYRDVIRRYTWLEGLGEPISQEIASKLPYYYRLSGKNSKGHYQVVEAFQKNELTSHHSLCTYIINGINGDKNEGRWYERLNTIGKWILYSDLSGENVVEERAYEAKDKEAKLVYVMEVVRNDSNHVTISYLDAWGFPADMNENNDNTYGSLVYVTYDNNGFDSVIDYLDGEGFRKANLDGVDQRRFVYDVYGKVIQATSNNCVGDYVIDLWGNCGYRNYYDDENNRIIRTNINTNLEPMRMPDILADRENTYISCEFILDQYGRKKEARVIDQNGNDDCTLSGIHRIVYSYDTKNNKEVKQYYDLNGSLIIF